MFTYRHVPSAELPDLPLLTMAGLPMDITIYEFRLLCMPNHGYYASSLQPGTSVGLGYCWFAEQADAEAAMKRLRKVAVSPTTPCPLAISQLPKWEGDACEIPSAVH